MSKAKVAAAMGAGVIALASPFIARWEGERRTGYVDIVGVATSCFGHTKTAVVGRRYTETECQQQLRNDVAEHSALIRACVPVSTPIESQAAFLSLAFNAGPGAVCKSTIGRRLMAGDLRGACDGLLAWNKARVRGKLVVVKGLDNRRRAERELCLKGLTHG